MSRVLLVLNDNCAAMLDELVAERIKQIEFNLSRERVTKTVERLTIERGLLMDMAGAMKAPK